MTDKERIAELEAERARLRAALEAAKPGLENFVADNPTFQYGDEMQDPEGAHAALKLVIAALSATGEQEHPDTVKHCCGAAGFGREWPGEPPDVCPACAKRAEQWDEAPEVLR